ncbi:hypothetical protein E2C01_084865 [Portunus trituberculatus]|uniref:Uncharacterized protein n=1 Tax=Portunus trituberculatus TaxID=210409 RepID=A0A5B7J136_PORTR|nr:hypothetical protein [Portunus trituberculatus]
MWAECESSVEAVVGEVLSGIVCLSPCGAGDPVRRGMSHKACKSWNPSKSQHFRLREGKTKQYVRGLGTLTLQYNQRNLCLAGETTIIS